MKVKCWFFRIFFYILSLLILALGIILNTKTGLGVSPIISVSYIISEIFHWNFGNTTLGLYVIFILAQLVIRGKNRQYYDLLQFPLCIVFTRFMNIFNDAFSLELSTFGEKLVLLGIAVILTGIGAAMSVNMRLIPNPGDGIVAAIADAVHKDMGFTKNVFDLSNICLTFIIGLISGHVLLGIGVGTIIAVIGVGRVIAGFNFLCKKKMDMLAGLSEMEEKYE